MLITSTCPTAATFTFAETVDMDEVRRTLHLARMAAEALHGIERVRMDVGCEVDPAAHMVAIDRSSEAGRMLAIVFLAYARREFGDHALVVRHELRQNQLATGGGGR
jgi:hypothetical protein